MFSRRLWAAGKVLAAILYLLLSSRAAGAQSLSVLPVNVWLQPGQLATTLTVTNTGSRETAIQIRSYAWNQANGQDQLKPSAEIVVSPPMASIAPGASQIVRLILRHPPEGQEATYRIVLDQIPPPAEAGVVHVVLRMSIPIFALPSTRVNPRLQFHAERTADQLFLIGDNDGSRHETIRDIVLSAGDGREFRVAGSSSPYLLAGTTRRWSLVVQDPLPTPGETLRLKARGDAGVIEQQVSLAGAP